MTKADNLEELKNELVREIKLRVNFIINDNRAFIYSKIQQATLSQNFIHPIGGGNFLMTQGVFSVLNLLSKINSVLSGSDLWTKLEKKELEEALKKFKKTYPKYIKLSLTIFPNQIKKTEKDCFVDFYNDTKNIVSWGIKDKEYANNFWRDFRNKLAHIALPHQPVAAYSPEQLKKINFDNFINFLKIKNENIIGLNGKDENGNDIVALSIELLSEKLLDLYLFIEKKIKDCSDEQKLNNIKLLIE